MYSLHLKTKEEDHFGEMQAKEDESLSLKRKLREATLSAQKSQASIEDLQQKLKVYLCIFVFQLTKK